MQMSKNDRSLQYNSMKTQKKQFSFKMKSKMECWNVIANESEPIVLFNGSPRNQIIVIVSPHEIKKDIIMEQFPSNARCVLCSVNFFRETEQVQTYSEICVLVSHLTYI